MTNREEIDALDVWQQMKIYFHYVSVQLGLKHNITIVDLEKSTHGWGEPIRIYPTLGAATYKLWSDIKIASFEDFLNSKNGMEDWLWKFRKEIII